MDATQLIVDLAKQIEAQQAAHQLWYWASVAAVSFLFGAAGSFVSEYFKKRGETKAIQADLSAIRAQQSSIAEAVARVQTEVSHEDWKKRELTTLRRQKLEELLIAAWRCPEWTIGAVNAILHRKPESNQENPIAIVKSLTLSFFPGLILETMRLSLCQSALMQVARREQIRRLTVEESAGKLPPVEQIAEKRQRLLHSLLLEQANMVVLVGAGIMRDLLGAEPLIFDTTARRDSAFSELCKFMSENDLEEPSLIEAFREELAATAIAARTLR